MKLVERSHGYDIYQLTMSESIMRGRNNRQFVAFVSGENFLSVGCPEVESESLADVRNYCEKWEVTE
ncbi:MAG: hypothetical protein HDT44_01120 [Ruminococcaceae bacterium]|nr:hypothetical protein [Oscillospiraceae bacterium]